MFSSFCNQVTESDAVDVVETAIKHHTSDVTTKAMALIALLKISSRFPSCSEYANSHLALLRLHSCSIFSGYCIRV